MARCSRCGMEFDMDIYVCDNCGYQLKEEKIETIPIFKRPSAKVYKPNKRIKRIIKVLNPLTTPIAFRDINNKKEKKGPRLIRTVSALMIGLWATAILVHIRLDTYSGVPLTGINLFPIDEFNFGTKYLVWSTNFAIFLVFFIFGLFYYFIVFKLYNWAFSVAANFSVQLDSILAVRYNVKVKKRKFIDVLSGSARLRRQKTQDQPTFQFEQARQDEVLTKIKQTGKYRIMGYAYAPIVVVNLLSYILLLIFLPRVELGNTSNLSSTSLQPIWDSWIWIVLDILQVIGLIWVAMLMSVAQREIGNTNTTRLLIGNLIVAGIIAFTTIMLRPTFGAGSWNIIDRLSGNG